MQQKLIVVKIDAEQHAELDRRSAAVVAAQEFMKEQRELIVSAIEIQAPKGQEWCVHLLTNDGNAVVHVLSDKDEKEEQQQEEHPKIH